MKQIYITGCAKSGTTLVRRLFNAFDLRVFNWGEINLNDFIGSNYHVAKRTTQHIFSYDLSRPDIIRDMSAIAVNDIWVVNVVRNKDDVCKDGRVREERWEACMKQAQEFSSLIDYTVLYERLVTKPDQVQKELMKILKLKKLHNFSDYPAFVDLGEEKAITRQDMYKLRPIGAQW